MYVYMYMHIHRQTYTPCVCLSLAIRQKFHPTSQTTLRRPNQAIAEYTLLRFMPAPYSAALPAEDAVALETTAKRNPDLTYTNQDLPWGFGECNDVLLGE